MKYTKLSVMGDDGILRESIEALTDDGKSLSIPLDPANSDYQTYLASLDGNTPTGLGSPTDPKA